MVRLGHPRANLLRHLLLDQSLLLGEESLLSVFVSDGVDDIEILPAMPIDDLLPDTFLSRLVATPGVHRTHLLTSTTVIIRLRYLPAIPSRSGRSRRYTLLRHRVRSTGMRLLRCLTSGTLEPSTLTFLLLLICQIRKSRVTLIQVRFVPVFLKISLVSDDLFEDFMEVILILFIIVAALLILAIITSSLRDIPSGLRTSRIRGLCRS